LGALLFVAGADGDIAEVAGGIAGIIVFLYTVATHTAFAPKLYRAPSANRRDVLVWGKLILVGAANWTLDLVLSDLPAALVFGSNAIAAVRNDRSVSMLKATFYRAVLASNLPSLKGSKRREANAAYAAITIAQHYTQITSEKPSPPISGPGTVPTVGSGGRRAIRLLGGPGNSLTIAGPSTFPGFEFPDDSVDAIFDSVTFLGAESVMRIPTKHLFKVDDMHVVIVVKNCKIIGLAQDLSRISWIDVVFENCAIYIKPERFALVNVSFVNCSVFIDKRMGPDIASILGSGNASGVNFSSIN
jgi:hypothetical protein